ncbi:alpha/beta fold hydrolase [Dyadobacter sandarakinus]|uniref:Alpha/beta fold hydrolase n=1 Tax=Dyadobacter sandarakinus TaxID=2747268 RepID=A0ABX7I5V6_9BACT|nr:alpha/beta fold hydrolase [Dyadobacter sandarakinus]QRR01481.1 alpha/beta fold hydrolase [Dyadobacter sandarakinus]
MAIEFEIYPFAALDGFACSLWRLKRSSPALRGPVLLVHGAGVRSNLFNPPTRFNLLSALAEQGYDVWLSNWRGSIACKANEWDLDQVAMFDHPAAVREVRAQTGAESIKAIVHCQGSTSFMIAAVQGLLPDVKTIVSNAVSLHPIVSPAANIKINAFVPLLEPFVKYLDPQWGENPEGGVGHLFRILAKISHREHDSDIGKIVSIIYGSGYPALWELPNLSATTIDWIRGEFGKVPLSFFKHIKKCINAGELVSFNGSQSYATVKPLTDSRFAFFAGKLNKCFSYQSQVKTYKYFNGFRSGFHQLYLYPTYSHLDVFFGEEANSDIFSDIIKELNQ